MTDLDPAAIMATHVLTCSGPDNPASCEDAWPCEPYRLAAEVAALRDKLNQVREEIAHAQANGHILSGDCQGVPPGAAVPAVRIDHLEAALERGDHLAGEGAAGQPQPEGVDCWPGFDR